MADRSSGQPDKEDNVSPGTRILDQQIDKALTRRGVGAGSGGGGPTDDDVERRVQALETAFLRLEGKIDDVKDGQANARLEASNRHGELSGQLLVVSTKLDAKASAEGQGRLEEAAKHMASKWFVVVTMTMVLGLFSALFVYVNHLAAPPLRSQIEAGPKP